MQPGNQRTSLNPSADPLAFQTITIPPPEQLPQHIADLALARNKLERGETERLLKAIGESAEVLRAAYIIMAGPVDPGMNFISSLPATNAPEIERVGFRRALVSWHGTQTSVTFENLWACYLERTEDIQRRNATVDQIRESVVALGAVAPKIQLVSSADGRGSSTILVRDLSKVDVIIKNSLQIEADIQEVLEHSAQEVSLEALTTYYRTGYRYVAHPFCFVERKESTEDAHDSERPLVLNLRPLLDGEDLRSSTSPLAFLEDRERTTFSPTENFALQTLEAFAIHRSGPTRQEQEVLIGQLLIAPGELHSPLVKLLSALCRQQLPLDTFRAICATLTQGVQAPHELAQCIEAGAAFTQQALLEACTIIEELVKEPKEKLAEILTHFQSGEISTLVQEVFGRRLQEHQRKFPEKPIDQVRNDFLKNTLAGCVPPPVELLDRALETYAAIQRIGDELRSKPRDYVITQAKQLMELRQSLTEQDYLVRYLAIARELFRCDFGVYPYNTQLITIIMLIWGLPVLKEGGKPLHGTYAGILTGEGKSLILALTAGYHASRGARVDVITSNMYLAARDARKFYVFFGYFGASCDSYRYRVTGAGETSDPQIIYSTNHDMIYGYLDSRLRGIPFFGNRRFDVALVDEADNLCLDLGKESVRIATKKALPFPTNVLEDMIQFADGIGSRYYARGIDAVVDAFIQAYPNLKSTPRRRLRIYLEAAHSSKKMERDKDFIVKDTPAGPRIVLVDRDNTGRLKEQSQWRHGVHEFVTLRHGLELSDSSGLLAQKGHPDFLNRYRHIVCISGTIGDRIDRAELARVFNLSGFDVPPHNTSRRQDLSTEIVKTRDQLLDRCLEIARTRVNGNQARPVLFLAGTIDQAKALAAKFRTNKISFQYMDGVDAYDADGQRSTEERVVREAGLPNALTISTRLAGRGTDIVLHEEALVAEGLVSVTTSFPISFREERQGRGRAGRQGQLGLSIVLGCIEDDSSLRTLPFNVEHHAEQFGRASIEITRLLEFSRQARNLVEALGRASAYQREQALQAIQEKFFTKFNELRERLGAANPELRTIPGAEGVFDPLSLDVTHAWANIFEELDLSLSDLELDQRQQVLKRRYDETQSLVNEHLLKQCFRAVFGATFEEATKQDSELLQLACALYRSFRRGMYQGEDLLKLSDPKELHVPLREAIAAIDQMIEEKFRKYDRSGSASKAKS